MRVTKSDQEKNRRLLIYKISIPKKKIFFFKGDGRTETILRGYKRKRRKFEVDSDGRMAFKKATG